MVESPTPPTTLLDFSVQVRLSVEVPAVVCEDCYQRVIREFTKLAKIPGFRPGKKVPETVLINHIGKKNVQKATIESILKRTFPHAMSSVHCSNSSLHLFSFVYTFGYVMKRASSRRANLNLTLEIVLGSASLVAFMSVDADMFKVAGRALNDSIRIVTKFSDMEETYSSQKFLRYDIIVDVAPEVKWVPENGYKNLKIVVEIDSDIDAQRASEQELKRRYKSLGLLRIITDRGLQIGDVVVLDISATTIDQDESNVQKIPSAESKGFHFDTEDGDKVLPGFLDSIIGIRQGETKSFPLVFPESWRQENLRGVHAQFTVECKELFYRELPELNDSLAEKLLPGCTTLEQVKESLLQRCLEVEQTAKEQATDNAILDQLHKVIFFMIEVDILNPCLRNRAGSSMEPSFYRYSYFCHELVSANMKLNEQQLASLSSPKAVNEYLESQKENITSVIKQNLAVGDIFRRENLQFPTEELVKEVENSISEFKRHKQEYDEERIREQVQEVLERAKVLEWLKEHAEIEYKTR
ncbi:Trigger factor-like protein TIG, Chloroplastic [Vitis vinifera]|uniref:peptidylprolyl isomerase n=1 Tax=Vitis vinifera TaxID=29760 RepID=A0A438D3F3_VITVI|nr:Trigger factor-like protein TIG, Chloroplastic [Vitis vinifera]